MVYNENSDSNLRQAWPSLNKNDLKTFLLMYKYLKQFSLENLITQSSFDIGIESWITSSTFTETDKKRLCKFHIVASIPREALQFLTPPKIMLFGQKYRQKSSKQH